MERLLFIIFIFISISTNAQSNLEEVVHLKNGGIIRGVIIEQIPNQQLKIQTRDGNVFVYSYDEIEKITKEAPLTPQINYQNIDKYNNSIQKEKSGGIATTVIGATFFAVGMPFMLQGIRYNNECYYCDGLLLARFIPGVILVGTGFPLLIAGPAKLGKYGRLKREATQNASIYLQPSLKSIDANLLPALANQSSYAIGGSFIINF